MLVQRKQVSEESAPRIRLHKLAGRHLESMWNEAIESTQASGHRCLRTGGPEMGGTD